MSRFMLRSGPRAAVLLLSLLVMAVASGWHGAGAASALVGTGDPSANRALSPATFEACFVDASGPACVNDALRNINAARASEGVVPMVLPPGFGSLSMPWQLLVLSNLERVDRELRPVVGLSASLDLDAAVAAPADDDPVPSVLDGDQWSANWAGGYASPLEADFVWMYDDGYGSGNGDCGSPNAAGCWGHRRDILATFANPIAMGAAAGTGAYGPSLDELFVGGDTKTAAGQSDAPLAPAWSAIARRMPLGVTPSALTLKGRALFGSVRVFASGEAMVVTAAIAANARHWTVRPRRCRLAAGGSCKLRLSVRGAGVAGRGTLRLTGPNAMRTVTLSTGRP